MLFHVMCFSVYKIFINPDMTFLRKYYMCMLCDSTVIYQYIYICISLWLLYLILTCIVLLSYVTFFYISTINCHVLLCELLYTTVWNTPILCHIHDFNKKFQVVVKLLIFIIEISLTYLNKYLFLIVTLHDM